MIALVSLEICIVLAVMLVYTTYCVMLGNHLDVKRNDRDKVDNRQRCFFYIYMMEEWHVNHQPCSIF
jgi:hypothetical protein